MTTVSGLVQITDRATLGIARKLLDAIEDSIIVFKCGVCASTVDLFLPLPRLVVCQKCGHAGPAFAEEKAVEPDRAAEEKRWDEILKAGPAGTLEAMVKPLEEATRKGAARRSKIGSRVRLACGHATHPGGRRGRIGTVPSAKRKCPECGRLSLGVWES